MLSEVKDPELPIGIVDLGLVYAVEAAKGAVKIEMTFTAIACPAMDFIMEDIRVRLGSEEGFESVEFDVVWSPPWTKERLTERGRLELRAYGVSV